MWFVFRVIIIQTLAFISIFQDDTKLIIFHSKVSCINDLHSNGKNIFVEILTSLTSNNKISELIVESINICILIIYIICCYNDGILYILLI